MRENFRPIIGVIITAFSVCSECELTLCFSAPFPDFVDGARHLDKNNLTTLPAEIFDGVGRLQRL